VLAAAGHTLVLDGPLNTFTVHDTARGAKRLLAWPDARN
jgi:hypothetical protein